MSDNTPNFKTPPNDQQSEQCVLGACLIDESAFATVAEVLDEDDFYHPAHRLVFSVMKELNRRNEPIDVMTVHQILSSRMDADLPFLSNLSNATPSAANVRNYALYVRNCSIMRKLITSCSQIATKAFETSPRSAKDLVDEAQTLLFALSPAQGAASTVLNAKDVAVEIGRSIDEYERNGGDEEVLPTGFAQLDAMTGGGLRPGEMIVIAGRPSMGKTALALNIATNIHLKQHKNVLVFSLEQPAQALVKRLISIAGDVESKSIRTKTLSSRDWKNMTQTINELLREEGYLLIDEAGSQTIHSIRSTAKAVAMRYGRPDLIVIDYLQLFQSDKSNNQSNRNLEIADISRGMKILAKEMKVPVIVLSQLNRKVDDRPDKRPLMSDLRESGAIEQDADLILFVYRDEVYNKNSPNNKNCAEVIVGKQREGATGTINLRFDGQFTRFSDVAVDSVEEPPF